MFELIICSLVTLVPDYLHRRYVQNKRLGKEITFYSVWYELRWGITGYLLLTNSLINMIFYFHPSTISVTLHFRTVPILPETSGRVAEVKADFSAPVAKVDLIFRLDSSKQEAALETAKLIDRVGLVHALLMRIQALLLPAKTRVLSGH